ncbi:MAG TPA: hypothetical protein VFE50_23545 [Cyclobacteriaceae bacterium]|nr:hypothetical protein [Cyclobacteriaceae bacterium]
MRYTTIILLILAGAIPSYSQDVLFKVIAYSDGVTIDGKAAKPGMNVESREGLVRIPEYGYCVIVTHEGLADVITKQIPVAEVPGFVRKAQFHQMYIPTLRLAFPFYDGRSITFMTDSVFLYWGAQETAGRRVIQAPTSEHYVVTFSNALGEEVYSKKSISNWIILPIASVMDDRDSVLLYSVRGYSPDIKSETARMKPAHGKHYGFVENHLARMPQNDRLFYECAFYQSQRMFIDQQWTIYKILKSGATTNDAVFKSYLSRLRTEFGLAHVSLK